MPTRSPTRAPSVSEAIDRVRGLLHKTLERAADRAVLSALRHGSPRVVVLPEDEYDAFMATLEVEEDAEAMDDLRAGQEESRQGLPPRWEELEDELGPLGKPQTDKAI